MREMICLGIESTAHTFGAGIVTGMGKVLANASASFKTTEGGLIPRELGRHHEEVKENVLQEALKKAGIGQKGLSLVSFSQGPGIASALLVGLRFAREIAVLD